MAASVEPPPRKPIPGDPAAYGQQTNIDRRTCKRVVPMEVMSFGVSRTGTASIRQALIDLGYSECYHFSAIMNENPRDSEMWNEAFAAKFEGKGTFGREDWDQLLGHCRALTDTPCAIFYKELIAAYPDAKVLLVLRDSPEQWWRSQMHTIIPFFDKLFLPPETWWMWLYRKFLPAETSFDRLNGNLLKHYDMYQTLCYDKQNGTKKGIEWFENYCAEVQKLVPKERLLVMKVSDGWNPLCKFLGKDVPAWEFPKVNTSADWDKNVGGMYVAIDNIVYWNMVKTFGPIAVGAVAVGVFWFFNRG